MIDICGLDKSQILMALYEESRPLGLGFLHHVPGPISKEEAQRVLLENDYYIDYLHGRVIKVNLKSDMEFNECLYDRDNGKGAAARAIQKLRRNVDED